MIPVASLLTLGCLTLAFATPSLAQLAGSRDLTASWRAPDDHLPSPSEANCGQVSSTISHDPEQPEPAAQKPSLDLSIMAIAPSDLTIGGDFTATIRLKNRGTASVAVPWQPDGEQVTKISQDGKAEAYEVADVTFRLQTGNKSHPPLFLDSEGALFASPDDRSSYLSLDPGHWVDIKLSGKVVCGLPECPAHAQPDDHGILTAWWYQRVLTHKVEGCKEDHGSHTVRELDSGMFPVVVHKAAQEEQK